MGGLLGIGGAIIIVPALVFFLGFSQQMAQGTTLIMLALPVGGLAAWKYYQEGYASISIALVLAVSFFLSSYFGARLATVMPGEWLKKIFALLLIGIAIKTLFFDKS
jgi:uncharacterized membrane protein YfcA